METSDDVWLSAEQKSRGRGLAAVTLIHPVLTTQWGSEDAVALWVEAGNRLPLHLGCLVYVI